MKAKKDTKEKTVSSCAVFGQHPLSFPWGFDEEDECCQQLKLELQEQLLKLWRQGVKTFYVACDYGVGLYAAEELIHLRQRDSSIELRCITPHEEQATKWAPYLRDRYFSMLEKCTHVTNAAFPDQHNPQLLAYQQIINAADLVLAVYDMDAPRSGRAEDQAMFYTMGLGKPTLNLNPYTLKVSSDLAFE